MQYNHQNRKLWYFYRQACAYAEIVFPQWSKNGLRCPDKREIWHGERLPRAKFYIYRGKNVGLQPQKLSKFRILARNLYLRGDSLPAAMPVLFLLSGLKIGFSQ